MVGFAILGVALLFCLAAAGILETFGNARVARALGLDDSEWDR